MEVALRGQEGRTVRYATHRDEREGWRRTWDADKGLNPNQRHVLEMVRRRLGRDNSCWPSQETLAQDCGLSERTVYQVLKQLVARGYLGRRRRHSKSGNRTSDLLWIAFPTSGELEPVQQALFFGPEEGSLTARSAAGPTANFAAEPLIHSEPNQSTTKAAMQGSVLGSHAGEAAACGEAGGEQGEGERSEPADAPKAESRQAGRLTAPERPQEPRPPQTRCDTAPDAPTRSQGPLRQPGALDLRRATPAPAPAREEVTVARDEAAAAHDKATPAPVVEAHSETKSAMVSMVSELSAIDEVAQAWEKVLSEEAFAQAARYRYKAAPKGRMQGYGTRVLWTALAMMIFRLRKRAGDIPPIKDLHRYYAALLEVAAQVPERTGGGQEWECRVWSLVQLRLLRQGIRPEHVEEVLRRDELQEEYEQVQRAGDGPVEAREASPASQPASPSSSELGALVALLVKGARQEFGGDDACVAWRLAGATRGWGAGEVAAAWAQVEAVVGARELIEAHKR